MTLNIPRRHSHMVRSRKSMEETHRWSSPHAGRGAGRAGRQSCGEPGGCLRRSGGRFDCLGPRETELHCQRGSQIERKQEREREGGGVLGLGGRDGWMDGGHREEGRDQQNDRQTEEERDCLISVCTYQHMDH